MTAVAGALEPGLRVFPQLRSAHVADIAGPRARRTLFFDRNYDLGSQQLPAHVVGVSLQQALREVLSSDEPVLELHEPLWARYLPHWLLLAAAWRLGRLRRPDREGVVFFAIENGDVLTDLSFGRRWLRPAAAAAAAALRVVLPRLSDRCAFGTPGAVRTYAGLLPSDRPSTALFVDVLRARGRGTRAPGDAVTFVGALEARKGIPQLLEAWPAVEAERPGARLTLIGDGPLAAEVAAWAAEAPRTRSWIGRVDRPVVLEELAGTAVLVAPSVRSRGWREQVGGPIKEALAHGATVVTTDETGLASYLEEGGHVVIAAEEVGTQLARGVVRALEGRLEPHAVMSSLPIVDGRIAADDWLHAGTRA